MEYWGHHIIMDVKGCDVRNATNPNFINKFIKDLVLMINMVPCGEPQLVHFADNTNKAGWTVIQLIQTSSIVGHFLDDSGDLYLDIFSCNHFDEEVVKDAITRYFNPVRIKTQFIQRKA